MKAIFFTSLTTIIICLGFLISPGLAEKINWTQWEKDNALAQIKDWLVIDPPGNSICYMKQSYQSSQKMEMALNRDGSPYICGNFFLQKQGPVQVSYRFDQGKIISFKKDNVSNCIKFPKKIIPQLKRKFKFKVYVKTLEGETKKFEQTFSLKGFMKSYRLLNSEQCNKEQVP